MNSEIKKHRMTNATVRLLDDAGRPRANQPVTITQTKHAFLFGTAAFDLVPLTNGDYQGAEKEKAEGIAEKISTLFNAATLPFYWARFEPQRGKPLTEETKNAARWCLAHNMTPKGHPLCWHTLTADWLLEMSNDEILAAQQARIRRDVADFAGLIDMWDVLNEAVIMPVFEKYDNGITRICKQNGRINTIRTMFETARETNPDAFLMINDFDVSSAYDILIEGCLAAGIQFDAIGIQSHMHQGWWGPEKTQWVLHNFERFGLPLHFSETTLLSGQLMPPHIVDLNDYQVEEWPSTPQGEARQVEETLAHFTLLFSHPLVESITWWDAVDGNWLNAPAGLIRRDGTAKPAYEELLKLVKGEWWVQPTELVTDAAGQVRLPAFYGEYELSCGDMRTAFKVVKGEDAVVEVRV